MNKCELMRRIQELNFAMNEAELFLDTHPENRQALDYQRMVMEKLDLAMEEYQNRFGPIVKEAVKGDRWTWVDGPWPWQLAKEEKEG